MLQMSTSPPEAKRRESDLACGHSRQVTGHCTKGLPDGTCLDLEGNTPDLFKGSVMMQPFSQSEKEGASPCDREECGIV